MKPAVVIELTDELQGSAYETQANAATSKLTVFAPTDAAFKEDTVVALLKDAKAEAINDVRSFY